MPAAYPYTFIERCDVVRIFPQNLHVTEINIDLDLDDDLV